MCMYHFSSQLGTQGVLSGDFVVFTGSMFSEQSFSENLIDVSLEALPFLAFGFFVAGLLKSFVSDAWVNRMFGNASSTFMSPIKGVLFGAPLPLCSCSVIPIANGLKRQGANKGTISAFLVSAPETGVDSLIVSYALLGPLMLIARLISAISTALITAWTVIAFTGKATPNDTNHHHTTTCCHGHNHAHTTSYTPQKTVGRWQKFMGGQQYAFTTLLDDSFKYMAFALVVTALMKTYIPTDFLLGNTYSIWAMILTVLISFPMYICASASTPIAAGLIIAGVSPGVALVFMLAGPASNVAMVVIARKLMGTMSAVIYVVTICVVSVGAGMILNEIVIANRLNIMAQARAGTVIPYEIAIPLSVMVLLFAIRPLRPYLGLKQFAH